MSRAARSAVDLDGEWRFVADPERLLGPATLPDGDPISVPGCWEAQVARPYRIITGWYRRSFDLPDDWAGGVVLLCFGAVMYRCAVYVNGRRVGGHEGGYTPFSLEIQEAARFGASNEVCVEVQNPLNAIAEYPALAVERVISAEEYAPDLPLSEAPHGKQTWYSSQSGIWKSVSLVRVPRSYISMTLIFPQCATEEALVRWRLAGADPADAELELTPIDPAGVRLPPARVRVAAGQREGETPVPVPQPVRWGIGTPNLYRLEARLRPRDGDPDLKVERFGMREIGTRDGMVTLNGEPIYLLGALDQDLYPDTISTPPSRAFLDDQLRLARELGFNTLRCHIKVPDPMYLEAADEAGMLLWCELPNWTRFTVGSAARGRATLREMVESMGNHPSIGIWTIINEDWGTRLRYERRDREWLRRTFTWLKALDPSRLVVDNSACDTPATPNFHLRSDLADFHVYFGADSAVRWSNMIEDFARRPAWLWSPHGDAEPRGDEPLVLSEFGGWGLPRLDRMLEHHGREPWWFGTGQGYYRPSGIVRRFHRYGMDRIWSSVDELADATQWLQYELLQYQIGDIRRHASITGYVVTELSDAYWEANGLLDDSRNPKVYQGTLAQINAPDVVFASLERRDLPAGAEVDVDLHLSSYGVPREGDAVVEWRLMVDGRVCGSGQVALGAWPRHGVASGHARVRVPAVETVADARLELVALDADRRAAAESSLRLAIMPDFVGRTPRRRIRIHDPLDIWGLGDRLAALGHRVVSGEEAELVVATELTPELLAEVESGARVLVLVRSNASLPEALDLRRRVGVHLRRLPHAGWPGQRSPWEGDWVSNFSWILPGEFPQLPYRAPLDFAYSEVAPDHVLLGYDPVKHMDEVPAGMFVGWVHQPAALLWTFFQGAGWITLTTFRLCPERGPLATTMLECLIDRVAAAARGRQAATADKGSR